MKILLPALCSLLCLQPAARAQGHIASLIPEVQNLPAPSWVKPGVRLTYYASGSTSTNVGGTASPKGIGGHGHAELYVVAMEPKRLVYELRYYSKNGQAGPSLFRAVRGKVAATPAAVENYWIHPKALAAFAERGHEGVDIARSRMTIAGAERNVVGIALEGEGVSMSYLYDAETGLLLRSSNTAKSRGADEGVPGASRSGGFMEFKDKTQLKLPWAGEDAPEWLARTRAIDFEGSTWMQHGSVPNPPQMPASARYRLVATGKGWGQYERSTIPAPLSSIDGTVVNGIPVRPTKVAIVSGHASPSGMWLPPKTIRKLDVGQRIASNEVTGFELRVHYRGPDNMARGQQREICVLRWKGPEQVLDHVYDSRSGGLIRVFTSDESTHTNQVFHFAGAR